MQFALTDEGGTQRVSITRHGDLYRIERDGKTLEVDGRSLGEDVWSILVGVRSHQARVRRDGSSYTVDIGSASYTFDLADPSRAALRSEGAKRAGSGGVIAPMPGRVVRILVREGAVVKQGEGLVVVEAMKMENELAAPADGTVAKILVAEGDTVEAGTPLITFASPES